MTGVTYDTGALIAGERRNTQMWKLHNGIVAQGIKPVVPAGVLAQVWRDGSGRQAPLAQILKQCQVEPLDETLAKTGRSSQSQDRIKRCGGHLSGRQRHRPRG